jgi:tetratricopeptide (TPR) repeat protein
MIKPKVLAAMACIAVPCGAAGAEQPGQLLNFAISGQNFSIAREYVRSYQQRPRFGEALSVTFSFPSFEPLGFGWLEGRTYEASVRRRGELTKNGEDIIFLTLKSEFERWPMGWSKIHTKESFETDCRVFDGGHFASVTSDGVEGYTCLLDSLAGQGVNKYFPIHARSGDGVVICPLQEERICKLTSGPRQDKIGRDIEIERNSISKAERWLDAAERFIAERITPLANAVAGSANAQAPASSTLPSQPPASSEADAVAAYNRGIGYAKNRDYAHAIELYDEAIRLNPNFAAAYSARALAHLRKFNWQRAIADYTEAIRLNPKDVLSLINFRGVAFKYKGDSEHAIADYTEAIKLRPNNVSLYLRRGELYEATNKRDLAIQDYDEAIRLNPNDSRARTMRALAYYQKHDYDRALVDSDEAIRLTPNDATAYNNRGAVYQMRGDWDRAVTDYQKALSLNPSDQFLRKVVESNLRNGKVVAVVGPLLDGDALGNPAVPPEMEKLQETLLTPGLLDWALRNVGKNAGAAGSNNGQGSQPPSASAPAPQWTYDSDRVIARYDEAIRLNPQDREAYIYRGGAYQHKGDYDRAIADFDAALRLDPGYWPALRARGDAYTQKGDYDRAMKDYDKAIRFNPRYALAFVGRGQVYQIRGERERAIADYRQALSLDPAMSKLVEPALAKLDARL